MRRLNEDELDARIHTFLDRKFATFPELEKETMPRKQRWLDQPGHAR